MNNKCKVTILLLTLAFSWQNQGSIISEQSHNQKQKESPSSMKEADRRKKMKLFYQRTANKPPDFILKKAVNLIQTDANKFAIDLGCGAGSATIWLLEKGWDVLAIDKDKTAFEFFNDKTKEKQQEQILKVHISMFEDLNLTSYPKADLIYAGYSIPFCSPEHFHAFWKKIVTQLKVEGIFAGQFFGKKHSWLPRKMEMTFHTKEEVISLLDSFSIEYFSEVEEEGKDQLDNPVYWHIFNVVVRKKGER